MARRSNFGEFEAHVLTFLTGSTFCEILMRVHISRITAAGDRLCQDDRSFEWLNLFQFDVADTLRISKAALIFSNLAKFKKFTTYGPLKIESDGALMRAAEPLKPVSTINKMQLSQLSIAYH